MRPSSITFQPYDRVTGTELSHQQQADCGYYYTVIKSYIDEVESQAKAPLPWTRKKLRCSTSELLDSIETLGDEILRRQRGGDTGHKGGDNSPRAAEYGETNTDTGNGMPDAATQLLFERGVNLLHELVSRTMDTAEGSTIRRTPPSFEWPYSSRRTLTLDSTSDSSPASSAFSHAPASRTSFVTSASAATGNSITLDEAKTTAQDPRGTPDKNEGAIFDGLPMQNPIDGAIEEKEKATHDWVLEYLRGGWLSNSPAKTTESTISPILPLAEDFSLVGNFRRPQRTASDEASAYSQDDIPPSIKGNSYFTKAGKHGRPIPTVTSRFKGKVGREMPHELVMGNSLASGPDHFKTPTSILSGATVFWTPDSGLGSLHSTVQPSNTSAWNKYLREKGLIPNPFEEMDWSGRGQHAEFDATEETKIPLILESHLGHSVTALVESVRCRRIRLARKTVLVSRRLKKEEAMKEVEHLQRLKHSHIIRVVGTYTLPRKLSILLYPVAEYTLETFLETTLDDLPAEDRAARMYSISTFLRCLAKAVAYIHDNAMKHMDIKPKNLLVRDMRNSIICNQGKYKIYIADFGIARSYRSVDDCNTESPTAYTKMYAAPEVVAQERRDQKADIFSLGAVFAEMLAVLANNVDPDIPNSDILYSIRTSDATDSSYAGHAPTIQEWLRQLSITTYGFESDTYHSHITELVALMLSVDPTERPTANMVVDNIPFRAFCCDVNGGTEPFEAANRASERQLYDRAFEISEADLRYFRCMVDACVKVYSSREKLRYHTKYGHGNNETFVPSSDEVAYDSTSDQSEVQAEDNNREKFKVETHTFRNEWSTF